MCGSGLSGREGRAGGVGEGGRGYGWECGGGFGTVVPFSRKGFSKVLCTEDDREDGMG